MKRKICLMLVAAMTLSFTVFLTSCGGGSGENGELYIYSYGDYYDPEIIAQFEDETGIKVIEDTYDTAEEMYPVIQNESVDYDIVCTSDYMIGKMEDEGMLMELDKDNIPNLANIDERYLKMSEEFDPGNKYSVPHTVGVAGIIYNKDMTGEDIDSWDALWDSKYADSMVVPDSVRDIFMIALRKLGYDQNTTNEDEIKAAAEELKAQKPLVYKYANDAARDLLADGSAAVGVVWNGEYVYTKDLNDSVEFVVPKEGTEFFIDSWVIPQTCKNKENAEKFMDFLCRADVAKTNFDYLYYTTPNKAALDLIEEEYASNEAIFPSDETLKNCSPLKTLDPETTDLYAKYWKEVKAN